MMSLNDATEYVRGMIDDGKLSGAAEANVMIIQLMGARVIEDSIPREIRSALHAAVKAGKLGRLAKNGDLPEVFYNGNDGAKWYAMEQQERVARERREAVRQASSAVFVSRSELTPTPTHDSERSEG